MSKAIAARLHAEPGWKAVFMETAHDGEVSLSVSAVHGWGLVLSSSDESLERGLLFRGLPLSMSGEVMSERAGFLCVLSPADDEEQTLANILCSVKSVSVLKAVHAQDAAATGAVISP